RGDLSHPPPGVSGGGSNPPVRNVHACQGRSRLWFLAQEPFRSRSATHRPESLSCRRRPRPPTAPVGPVCGRGGAPSPDRIGSDGTGSAGRAASDSGPGPVPCRRGLRPPTGRTGGRVGGRRFATSARLLSPLLRVVVRP